MDAAGGTDARTDTPAGRLSGLTLRCSVLETTSDQADLARKGRAKSALCRPLGRAAARIRPRARSVGAASRLALFGRREPLDANRRGAPSVAWPKRLATREAEAVRSEFAKLKAQAADSESRVVKHRATRLADTLRAKPFVIACGECRAARVC
jgi:hypothetical protein